MSERDCDGAAPRESKAVRIELFTARVLCRASYRLLEYSTDTGSGY